jgi:hypothetical protein
VLAFLRALASVLDALVPLIKERTRHARIERIKQGYRTRLEATLEDPAAAFAEFDDDLRSEGILPADGDRGVGGDKPLGRDPLPSHERLVD